MVKNTKKKVLGFGQNTSIKKQHNKILRIEKQNPIAETIKIKPIITVKR